MVTQGAGPVRGWEAEHVVNTKQAAELIRSQFPGLAIVDIRPLDSGWDNTVYTINDSWVFRFPRREVAVPGIRRELLVLGALAKRLSLSIPNPEFIGIPVSDYPWPFYGARSISGRELAETEISDQNRARVAGQMGAFLRELHAVDITNAVFARLPRDPLSRADPCAIVPKARSWLEHLTRRHLWQSNSAIEALFARANEVEESRRTVLVHGDLHIRHVLIDDGTTASGVIDWGDVCLADPSVDLALAYAAFAGTSRRSMLSEYGDIDEPTELRARVLAVFLSAALAEYAADTRRSALLAEALAGLRRAESD